MALHSVAPHILCIKIPRYALDRRRRKTLQKIYDVTYDRKTRYYKDVQVLLHKLPSEKLATEKCGAVRNFTTTTSVEVKT